MTYNYFYETTGMVGLLLLKPVFIRILGFGSAEYKGNPDQN